MHLSSPERIWNMDTTGIRVILLLLVARPTACSGFDVTVDVRPPAGTVGGSVLFAVSIINPPPGSLQYVAWTSGTSIVTYQTGTTIISPMYTGRVVFNSSTGSLELKNLTVKDTGKYTVSIQLTGTSDQPQKSVDLTVYEKISGATISGLTAELIAGNSSLNLSCQASAGSISNRLWLKDGQSLSPSNRVTFTADNSSMDIKKVEKDDAGQYKCSLSNLISTATAERDVVVNYGPESVTVQGEKTVKINTKVVLECSASSVPPAGFMWTFNETLTNVKTNTFVIEKANYNDSGDYSCVASNAVTGLKSTSVHTLVVKGDINQSNGGLSGGAIAAIVIVLLLVFAAVGAGIFIMKKKKLWLFADSKAGHTQYPQPTGQQGETVYTDVTCVRKPNGEQAKQGQSNGQSSQMPTSSTETEYSTIRGVESQPEKM